LGFGSGLTSGENSAYSFDISGVLFDENFLSAAIGVYLWFFSVTLKALIL
jgi:hypothetical protein